MEGDEPKKSVTKIHKNGQITPHKMSVNQEIELTDLMG